LAASGSGAVATNIVNPDRVRGEKSSVAFSFTALALLVPSFASAQYLYKVKQ